MLNYRYIQDPTPEEIEQLKNFYNSIDFVTIEQYPQWENNFNTRNNYLYFTAWKEDELVCFAKIHEVKRKIFLSATIEFGPIFREPEFLIESIQEIYDHYKKNKATKLEIHLAMETGPQASYIEFSLASKINYTTPHIVGNWSSIRLSLDKEEDVIFRNFSKGHKSDIKKAIKQNVSVVSDSLSESDIINFNQIYLSMLKHRDLSYDKSENDLFINIRQFLNQEQKGTFYLVKDEAGQILGGIIVIYQGHTVRYYKGAANPELRNIPILHIALWEAIKDAKSKGFKYFDFWGYNHWVDESNQIYFINRFKKGFGGDFIFYPKVMISTYRPIINRLYTIIANLKHKIKKR